MRVRPGRGSRPRSKDRPVHADAVDAFVTAVDRGRYTCLVRAGGGSAHFADPTAPDGSHSVIAMRARELRRQPIVVGDHVALVGDTSGRDGTLARAVRITERQSILRRSADDSDPAERVVVANADLLLIVVAAADPEPRTGFIDRCLVAAYTGNLRPLLLITKTDLHDADDLAARYADLELSVLTSGRNTDDDRPAGSPPAGSQPAGSPPAGSPPPQRWPDRQAPDRQAPHRQQPTGHELQVPALDEIRRRLTGHVTALIGQSGVGKSTLVNALVPEADRAIGAVTGVGKGRHVSTSARALPLAEGGWIIDTPGVRSFGLAHVTADDLLESFGDLVPATADCPPGCTHRSSTVGCALDELISRGEASAERLASFRRLLASCSETGAPGGP